MHDLRVSSETIQRALAHLYVPCGGLIIDEVPQGAAALYHAVSLRCTYGRAAAYDLELAEYADRTQVHGAIPIVVECGDELQLPPVPESASLFADMTNVATEHGAGVEIFRKKHYVYRLQTMKRFNDPILVSILTKMRKQNGCKLTSEEWEALASTNLTTMSQEQKQVRLSNTELWYQAGLTWAIVSMAQAIRSRLSAEHSKSTLYFAPAEDYVLDRPHQLSQEDVAQEVMRHPNMNDTGRLPSVAMLHIGMEIRLTMKVEPPEAVNDCTGVVLGFDLHPEDAAIATEHEPYRILRHLPNAVLVRLDECSTEFLPPVACALHVATGARRDCKHCDFRPGCLAVEPQLSIRSFKIPIVMPDNTTYEVRVQRKQLPLTIKTASTLQTLQGTTAEPGLIFHWTFPRFYSEEMRWLATYVALSRPLSLAQFLSVDMPPTLRSILEGGPPEGIISRFNEMFAENEQFTAEKAKEMLQTLGWESTGRAVLHQS